MSNLQKRTLAAAIYFPLLLLAANDSMAFALYMALVLGCCWHEYLSFRFVPVKFSDWFFHFFQILLGSLPAIFAAIGSTAIAGLSILFLFLQWKVVQGILDQKSLKEILEGLGFHIFGALYLTLSIWLLVEIQRTPNGREAIWFLLFTVAITDTAAYFAGKQFGKTPFFQHISPSKTWEGAAGGISGAMVLSVVIYFVFRHQSLNLPPLPICLVMAAVIAVTSIFGDLFESLIKRSYGVKDSGKLIPGHGGVLDRFDGVIFAAVPMFFYVILRGGFR